MDLSPVRDFWRFFRVVLAETPELRAVAFRVRYRVYCLEFGYEPKDRFPNGQESDDFDETSLQALVVHRASGEAAACVRLVPAVTEQGSRLLPFEKNCQHYLDRERIDALEVPRATVCEISRLAVDRSFRRRRGEELTRFGAAHDQEFTREEQRTLPLIAVSAYLAATAMTDLTGRRNVFAMMETFLPRLMSRVGIHFEKVGDEIDYHGLRAPYFIRTEAALRTMAPALKDLYRAIRRELAGSLSASPTGPQARRAAS
jgi:N-acyl amino acid synthase of PEP-CTERM/exosortase system